MAIKGTHFPFLTLLVAIIFTEYLRFNVVHGYNRPPPRKTIFTFHKDNDSAPQQVHISQVGQDKMRISWIAESPTLAKVEYNQILSKNKISATGTTSSYRYLIYNYGEIHNVVIGPLKPNNAYHYRLGESPKTYNFKTAPDQFPIKFAIVGKMAIMKSIIRARGKGCSKVSIDICLDGDALLSSSLIRVDDDAGYLKVSLYDNGTCPSKHISILSSKDKGSMLASYIGFLVRQHIPITCDNWRSPDLKVGKEKIWSEIQACVSIEDGYLPKVTFVVVQKRHHTRLFLVNPKETDRSGNIMPGTVVDTGICHPREFDFYLNSHAGIQGTTYAAICCFG